MARHYTTRDFFRQMPNALLERHFKARGVLMNLDFAALPDTRPDELFAAWLALPDKERDIMDAEFKEVFDLGSEKGFRAILDESVFWFRDTPPLRAAFVEKLSGLPNHLERAMAVFLDHKELWRGASYFCHADSLSYWRKRKNLPQRPAALDHESRWQLAELLRQYFNQTEGRGRNCVVEVFRRSELDYFFAYPEDYSQNSVEWVEGEFKRRPHNPAFEVIYVYSEKDGTLDLNYRGGARSIEPLQGIFAQAILKLPQLPTDAGDDRVYDLTPLMSRDFRFVYQPAGGIQRVVLKKMRLSARHKRGSRITVEADTTINPFAVHDLVEEIGKSVPLKMYEVTQLELCASIQLDPKKAPKQASIRITHPNSCSLKYDELDNKLRAMLVASGIEPQIPQPSLSAEDTNEAAAE